MLWSVLSKPLAPIVVLHEVDHCSRCGLKCLCDRPKEKLRHASCLRRVMHTLLDRRDVNGPIPYVRHTINYLYMAHI